MLSVVRRITDRIGVFWTFILVAGSIGLVWEAVTTADRDDTGEIIDAGSLDVFAVQTGDCFDMGQAGAELIESFYERECQGQAPPRPDANPFWTWHSAPWLDLPDRQRAVCWMSQSLRIGHDDPRSDDRSVRT